MLTFQAAGSGVLKYPASLQTLLQRSSKCKRRGLKDLAGEPCTPGELKTLPQQEESTTVRREIKTVCEELMGGKLSNVAEGPENLREWKNPHIPGGDPSKRKCQRSSNLIQVYKTKSRQFSFHVGNSA